jgi:polar amino acid transport system substrate-binding protein
MIFNINLKQKCKMLFLMFIIFHFNICLAKNLDIILVTEHFPPFQIVGENNTVSGFTTELVLKVLTQSQYQYSLDAYPWTVAYNLVLLKPNHCLFSMARLKNREDLFQWVGKVTDSNNAFLWGLKSDKYRKINNIDDLKNYRIAVRRNNAPHLALLEMGFTEDKHLYVLENANALINLLHSRDEIDFIIADDITIAYRAEMAGIDINLLKKVYEIEGMWSDFYLACNKETDNKIINRLSTILEQMHRDGTYRRLLDKWTSKMIHIE